MKHRSQKLQALILASCVAAIPAVATHVFAQTDAGATTATAPRKTTRRRPSSIESQMREMRQEFQQQQQEIDQLKQQLQSRDQQLQQAQDAAQQAQQSAQQAQAQAQQSSSSNNAAYTNLKQAVDSAQSDAQQAQQAAATAEQDQKMLRKRVLHPDNIYYKGITISPHGSFIEAATVYRSAATGGGINTPFTSVPLQHSGQAQVSEFFGSGRQSRIALSANGNLDNVKMKAYYEMDWLGTGITSNNNQSNSYVVRMRQLWARAMFNDGWYVSGGQMWSLTTETTHGLENGTEILPGTIDPQYTAGFVWNRQYGFRVAKAFDQKFWLGASLENDQALPGGSAPTNEFLGSPGVGGGLYNSTANYSYNLAPEIVAKMAYDGWGHWELFGVSRFFRNRIYPNASASTPSSAGAYNDTVVGGGIGGGFRVPLADKRLSIGLKGLYGDGTGRMGDSTIADLTFRSDGTIALLHNFSALSTVEASPTKKLSLYFNYGGDYVGRNIQDGGKSGYGLYTADMSGCNTEGLPTGSYGPAGTGNCKGNNKDVQEFSSGYWYNFYSGAKGRFRMGMQYSYIERNLWSGDGGTTNPGGNAKGTDNIFETSMRYYLP